MPSNTLITYIKDHAIETSPEGEFFTLKSGAKSRYYIDCKKVTLESPGLEIVVSAIAGYIISITTTARKIDAIGGLCVGADPIVGGLLCVPWLHHEVYRGFLVRKESKDHGKEGRIIGCIKPGDNCVMIEDVTTTGGSLLDGIDEVEKIGASVVAAIAVIDRCAGAKEALDKRGIPFYPLVTIADLGLQ
jgi:orotate phosphoribosyltransferase